MATPIFSLYMPVVTTCVLKGSTSSLILIIINLKINSIQFNSIRFNSISNSSSSLARVHARRDGDAEFGDRSTTTDEMLMRRGKAREKEEQSREEGYQKEQQVRE